MDVFGDIKQFVEQNRRSAKTKLFAFLALMNSYNPESYLLKSECQAVLKSSDPSFEETMKPFTAVIDTSSTDPEHVFIKPQFAQEALVVLTELQMKKKITRSAIVKNLISKLCGDQSQKDTKQFVKDLLTKREMGEHVKKKFSRLIDDIYERENFSRAVSVLETASKIMTGYAIFPQTLARLYYIEQVDDEEAEKWAKIAIKRAPNSSYVADTLAQIYKNHLLGITTLQKENLHMALKTFRAFKDVEEKAEAEAEVRKEMNDEVFFNIGGHRGFMQVAEITFEKIQRADSGLQRHIQSFIQEVEDKFSFFEWYLTYSRPSKESLELPYFWRDVALCYQQYTEKKSTDSTSFPGLLDYLNHGQFMSKGRCAGLKERQKTVSDLEAVCDNLKLIYEGNNDVQAAQRYILSNIILSNKTQNSSPKVAPVRELQEILQKLIKGTKVKRRHPELSLLVLMLFWPEDPKRVAEVEAEEEVKWPVPKLPKHVAFMEQAFERVGYAKYLRGRYLLPLFFLGKGSGLNKWIHKSTLDAIVEEKVDAELANSPDGNSKKKWGRFCGYWNYGKVWQISKIQEILLPVEIEPMTVHSQGQQKRVVRVGGLKIPATAEFESDDSALRFYLGLTIKGPVVFKVEKPRGHFPRRVESCSLCPNFQKFLES